MTKKIIFMSSLLKKPGTGPRICVASDGATRAVLANEVQIKDTAGNVIARVVVGDKPKMIAGHMVRAWVEVDSEKCVGIE